MEALQCRNAAVWAMTAKAAAGEVQGRAVRIKMSRNGAQGVGHVNHSSLSPSRDWRVCASNIGPNGGHRGEDFASTGLYTTVEKSNNFENPKNGSQRYGSSEVYCDEGSSFVAVETVLESEGGKSVEDYKLRAHIFSESDVFFTALKNRNNGVAK